MSELLMALQWSAYVAVMTCLITESDIAAPIREVVGWKVLLCPICLGIWMALPSMYFGFLFYFLVVALSNVWMLVILNVYDNLER
jgi:hypothetical protein